MKKIALLASLAWFISSCTYKDPCTSVSLATKDYLNVKFVSNVGIGGFVDNGYSTFTVAEVNQTYSTEYNGYYDGTWGSAYTSLKLPIAHNYEQTTFIFKGDTVVPETLIVNAYNARAELSEDCGYRLVIDEPQIKSCTFSTVSKPVYDASNRVLSLQIIK
jgi:hypothetical protein